MSTNYYTLSLKSMGKLLFKPVRLHLFNFRFSITTSLIAFFCLNCTLNANAQQVPCMNPIDAQAHISPEADVRVCPKTQLTFMVTPFNAGTKPFVEWFIAGIHTAKDTGLTITFKANVTGLVCARLTARDLDTKSTYCLSPIPVVANCVSVFVESVEISKVNITVDCINKTETAAVISPATNVFYSFDGAAFNNNPSRTYSMPGHHSVIVQEIGGLKCYSDPTDFDIVIPQDFTLAAKVTPPICANPIGKITAVTSSPNSATLFSFDGGATYGSLNTMNKLPGDYVIKAQSGLGCPSASVPVNVPAVKFDGITPNITSMGSTLMASDGMSWQWFLNGQPIKGATQQTYMPLTFGDYTVQIKNAYSCVATSAVTRNETDYGDNCPQIHKNFGAKCDDGNPNTINDRVRNNCKCRGDLFSPNLTAQCPDNIVVMANDPYGTVVSWDTKFTTNCTAGRENYVDVVQTSGYYSGYPFENNSFTQIEYVATDLCGNKTACSFFVTVSKYFRRTPTNLGLNTKSVSAAIPVVVESIYPNPVEDDLHLKISSLDKKEVAFQFYNSLGSSIKSEKRLLDKGENDIIFDVTDFQGGVYYVIPQITLEHNVPTKFVKF